MRIRKQFSFEAAHVLPHHTGKCGRLHGHSYRLEVTLRGPVRADGPAQGMVMDFAELSHVVKSQVIDLLDHRQLNDIVENPTCERVLAWIAETLLEHLSQLDEVVLWETSSAGAVLSRDELVVLAAQRPVP